MSIEINCNNADSSTVLINQTQVDTWVALGGGTHNVDGSNFLFTENVDWNSNMYFVMATPALTIDGQNNTITVIDPSSISFEGLIQNGFLSPLRDGYGGTIKNIILDGSTNNITLNPLINSQGWILQAFGNRISNNKLTIENCSTSGVIGIGGGICGSSLNYDSTADVDILNCNSSGIIGSATSLSYGGGICSLDANYESNANMLISCCYTTGDISGIINYGGGICGYQLNFSSGGTTGQVTIEYCYTRGTIIADSNTRAGGLCGAWNNDNTTGTVIINNCYTTTPVSSNKVGGLCGDPTRTGVTVFDSYSQRNDPAYLPPPGGHDPLDAPNNVGDLIGSIGLLNSEYYEAVPGDYPILICDPQPEPEPTQIDCICHPPAKPVKLNNSTVHRQFSRRARNSMRLRTGLRLR